VSDLNEMWAALERYQPYADKAGHGESWKRMVQEWTPEAADAATDAAWIATRSMAVASAAAAAAVALSRTKSKNRWDRQYARDAIKRINKAMEVQP
jgi:hypothetical protein